MEVSREQFMKLGNQKFSSEDELTKALNVDDAAIESETMAAIGGGYELGNIVLPPVTAGIIPFLEAIDSPFLDNSTDEIQARDIMTTLYVMVCGADAVRPVLAIQRRRKALEKQSSIAEKSAELFDRYLAAIDKVERSYEEFEAQAAEYWDTLGPVTPQAAADMINAALNDAFGGLSAIPTDGGSDDDKTDKKKAQPGTPKE